MNRHVSYRWAFGTITLAALYALLAGITLRYFSGDGVVSLIWPSSGLALAALLIGGKKYWPGVFIGALAGNMAAGSAFGVSLLIAGGNTLEAITTFWLLMAHRKFDVTLTRPLDYLLLAIAASVGASASALAGTSTLYFYGLLPQPLLLQSLLHWWQGDMLGILLVTPLILVWRQPLTCLFRCPRFLEGVACFGLALLFSLAIFLSWFYAQIGPISRGYWMFLFVAWAGMRFGRHGAMLIIGMAAVLAPLGNALGVGIFGTSASQINVNNLWFYLLILTTVGIILALSIHMRNRAEQREHLRTQVLELIAKNAPFPDVLNAIVLEIERLHPRTLCSILLLDKQGKHLLVGAAPSLPDFYNNTVCGLEIGAGAGSCGTTAFSGERVIVENIQTHPYWAPYRELAAKAGLAACWSEPIKDASGNVLGTFAIYHRKASAPSADDIQVIEQAANLTAIAIEKQATNNALLTSSEHLRTIIDTTPECVKLVDSEGKLLSMNAAGLQMIEADDEASVIGKDVTALVNPEYREAYRQFNAHVCQGEKGSIEFEITGLKGAHRWMETHAVPFLDKTTGQTVQLGITRDITQRKESQDLIWRQANFDLLTGLPNRYMFQDRLQQSIKKAHRSGLPMALLFIDLDRFKEVNDSLGHDIGDMLLQEAARRLSHCVRETDVIARLGGDEFTIIAGDLHDPRNLDHIAQNVLRELSKPFELNNDKTYISASIGITLYPDDATDIDALLRNADQAMYQAKNTGRNRFCYFTKAMQEAAQSRMRLERELHLALAAGDQFHVHYQPIVHLETGIIHKVEALIRWQHPMLGMVSPATFIPVAEDTGMIVEIGNWIFDQAVQQVIRWRTEFAADFQVSVNKSPAQILAAVKMQNSWCNRLKQLNLPGQSLVVEITEGLLLESNEEIKQHLLDFRDAGIQVALDDFGTGYSSLSYLKKFDIDYLKIDQSFIRNLKVDSEDFAVCEAIVVMAHKLNMKVIAEGVETAEQRDLLLAIGCDYAQGYLFSKPVPADEFEQLLMESALVH